MIGWWDFSTKQPEEAKKFFASMLGWTYEDSDHPDYKIVKEGDKPVGGIMAMNGSGWEAVQPHWMPYVNTDNIEASVTKAIQLGAKICVPVTQIPNKGLFAIVEIPGGGALSFYQK